MEFHRRVISKLSIKFLYIIRRNDIELLYNLNEDKLVTSGEYRVEMQI